MGKISDVMRQEVVDRMLMKKTQSEVSRELGISQPAVRAIWFKYLNTGSIKNLNRSGRPLKTTEKERRLIGRISKKSPFLTARQIGNELGIYSKVSIYTVRRVLRNCGLFGRIAARKPLLNKNQILKRQQWCKAYSVFSVTDWKNVIFSDESRIERFSMRRRYVRRPIYQRFLPRYTTKTVKYGGFSILVWGAIKGDGSRILIRCPARLDSNAYQAVLDAGLQELLDGNSIFMHDGAPCHRSLSTRNYLDGRNICVLCDWPPQSPDFNPIENLWSIVKEKVAMQNPKNSDELWNCTKQQWDLLGNDVIVKLYDTMPGRIKVAMKCKGHQLKY